MNRNKLVSLFISNLSNAIVHKVLENSIDRKELVQYYHKEIQNSLSIAAKYREKINPLDRLFPDPESQEVREEVIQRARSELTLRISKGYTNIDLSLVEIFVDELLKDLNVL